MGGGRIFAQLGYLHIIKRKKCHMLMADIYATYGTKLPTGPSKPKHLVDRYEPKIIILSENDTSDRHLPAI